MVFGQCTPYVILKSSCAPLLKCSHFCMIKTFTALSIGWVQCMVQCIIIVRSCLPPASAATTKPAAFTSSAFLRSARQDRAVSSMSGLVHVTSSLSRSCRVTSLLAFCGWVMLLCVCIPQFLSPSTCRWLPRLVPRLGCHGSCCTEPGTEVPGTHRFHCLYHMGCGNKGSSGISILWRNSISFFITAVCSTP